MNRFALVRELVKDPSLRVTEIAWKTGYNKGHVSRLRKEAKGQEPVAWMCKRDDGHFDVLTDQTCKKCFPVYTAPQKKEWVGLTDRDIDECYFAARRPDFDIWAFAEEIEERLKEKNT